MPLARPGMLWHLMAMEWIKILHVLAVLGWMTSVFAVPRALIYWKREWAERHAPGPLGELTWRLYRFSALLAIIAIVAGIWLAALGWGFPAWLRLKSALVLLLAAHYVWTGVLVRRARRGVFRESDLFLRIFNEVSVLLVIAILWAVIAKPF